MGVSSVVVESAVCGDDASVFRALAIAKLASPHPAPNSQRTVDLDPNDEEDDGVAILFRK